MLNASIKFNFKPKTGISYMQAKGLIAKEPQKCVVEDIFQFLTTTQTLDKTKIGEYLGDEHDINKEVLYYLVDSHDFRGVYFVDALKQMLSKFRLPGEG